MRINKASIFRCGPDAISIAISNKSRMAFFLDHNFLRRAHMRLNWLRIDARKERVDFTANLHMLNAALLEDFRQHVASRAVHAVDSKLEVGFCDLVQIGKFADRFNVGRLEISFFHFGCFAFRHGAFADISFNLLDDCRRCGPAVGGFELHAIPIPRIMA